MIVMLYPLRSVRSRSTHHTKCIYSQRADGQPIYGAKPKDKKQAFSLGQIQPAGVPSVPVPTDLSPHSHQLQLRLHNKNTSKLRTALKRILVRATTMIYYKTLCVFTKDNEFGRAYAWCALLPQYFTATYYQYFGIIKQIMFEEILSL